MSTLSAVLSALLVLAMVVWLGPNILALNQGKILRNIALWLAIFLALGLVYQNFGPGKNAPARATLPASGKDEPAEPAGNAPVPSEQDYTPPKEE